MNLTDRSLDGGVDPASEVVIVFVIILLEFINPDVTVFVKVSS